MERWVPGRLAGRGNARVVSALATAVTLGGLLACTSAPTPVAVPPPGSGAAVDVGSAPGSAPAVTAPTWERITDPSFGRPDPIAVANDGLAVGDEVIFVGARAEGDGEPFRPFVWSSVDGAEVVEAEQEALGQDRAWMHDASRAEDDTVVAVGFDYADGIRGRTWSRDPEGTWSTATPEFPGMDDTELSLVTGVEEEFVAVGPGASGGKRSMVVARRSTAGVWEGMAMEGTDDAEPTSITSHDGSVLITGARRVDDGVRPTGWFSSDAGVTWTEVPDGAFGPVGSGRPTVSTFVAGEWLVFGTGADGSAMAGWRSADGSTWTEIDATIDGEPIEVVPAHLWPFAGIVLMSARSANGSLYPVIVSYDPDAGFTVEPYPDTPGVEETPLAPGPLVATLDALVLSTVVPRSMLFTRLPRSGRLDVTVPGEGPLPRSEPFQSPSTIAGRVDGLVIGGAEGPRLSEKGTSYDATQWVGEPGRMDLFSVDASNLAAAVAGDDGTVVVAGSIAGAGTTTAGASDLNDLWVGTVGTDGDVDVSSTIGGDGEQLFGTLAQVGDRWYVGGGHKPDILAPAVDAAIWSSPDRTTWTREGGGLEDAWIAGICAAGSTVLAVGSAEDESRVSHPMAWLRGDDGTWTRSTDAAGLPDSAGALTGCASRGADVVVIGVADDRPVVARTSDGTTFTDTGFPGEEHVTPVAIAATDDGFAVIGNDRRKLVARPVLWTSRTGTAWTTTAAPLSRSGNPSSPEALAFVGTTLHVVGSDGSAPALWAVRDPFLGAA